MNPISVVLIVKNESHNIKRCLEAVSWADEIIVLDTGSTDGTLQLAAECGAQVHILESWEGFGKAKQQAVNLATHDWIFSLDADEVVTPELHAAISRTIADPHAMNGYRVHRRTWFLTQWIDHCGWDHDEPLRLFRKSRGGFTPALVHESIKVEGQVGLIKEPLQHYSYPTLEQHQSRLVFYANLWAEEQYRKGKKDSISNALFHSIWKFITMYFLQKGFLDGKAGFILSIASGYSVYYKHIRLWEMNQNNR